MARSDDTTRGTRQPLDTDDRPDDRLADRLAELTATQQAVDRWLASLSSENTRAAYRLDLAAYLRWCDTDGRRPLTPSADVVERFRSDPALPAGRSATARRAAALNGSCVSWMPRRRNPTHPQDRRRARLPRRAARSNSPPTSAPCCSTRCPSTVRRRRCS